MFSTHQNLPKICNILHRHIDIQQLWFVNLIQQELETENQNCKFCREYYCHRGFFYCFSIVTKVVLYKNKVDLLNKK